MNGLSFLMLIILSAFTMNLTLQCALGIKGAAQATNCGWDFILVKSGILFTAVLLLWFFFSMVIFSLVSGIFIYVLLFPVSYIVYEGLDFILFNHIIKKDRKDEDFISFPGGVTAAAVFLCINIAGNFLEAAVLSFGFAAGILLVFLIVREIRKRAALESVPRFLRGKPLALIIMGMLSLVFSVTSLLFLRIMDFR